MFFLDLMFIPLQVDNNLLIIIIYHIIKDQFYEGIMM